MIDLKVVFFTGSSILPPISGTRKLIYDTAIELAKKKHRVLVVSLVGKLNKKSEFTRVENVVFITIPLRRPLQDLLSIMRFLIYSVFPSFQFALFWLYPKFLKISGIDYSQLFRSTDYDVFICEDSRIFDPVMQIRNGNNAIIAYHLHSIEAKVRVDGAPFTAIPSVLSLLAFKLSKVSEERAIKGSDLVLTLSRKDSRLVRSIYGESSKCVGVGTDIGERKTGDAFLRQKGLERSQYLLYVSSYFGGLDAIVRVAEALPEYCFVLVGKASSLLRAMDAPSNVRSLGVVSDDALEELYKYSKAVLVPMPWGPGLGVPVKLIEALAHGKPVIVSLTASQTLDGIKHLRNAIVFDTFSQFVESIQLVFNDQELGRKLGMEAGKYALENFSWTKVVIDLEKALEGAIFERSHRFGG